VVVMGMRLGMRMNGHQMAYDYDYDFHTVSASRCDPGFCSLFVALPIVRELLGWPVVPIQSRIDTGCKLN